MKFVIAAVMAFLPSYSFAAGYSDAVMKPYGELRDLLFLDGWLPAPLTDDDDCKGSFRSRCAIYPEARDCAGSGSAPCKMLWIREGETLPVYTAGELPVVVIQVGDQ